MPSVIIVYSKSIGLLFLLKTSFTTTVVFKTKKKKQHIIWIGSVSVDTINLVSGLDQFLKNGIGISLV